MNMKIVSFERRAAAVLLLFLILGMTVPDVAAQQRSEQRCGWFSNPTPANAWLTDKDGEWIISTQGSYSAEGDWPNFSASRWIKTNINYGYGCACMKVVTEKNDMRVTRILSAASRPVSVCRRDKAISRKEPK